MLRLRKTAALSGIALPCRAVASKPRLADKTLGGVALDLADIRERGAGNPLTLRRGLESDKLFLTEYSGEVKDSLKEKTPPTGGNRRAGGRFGIFPGSRGAVS